jgi:membrane-anchored glycerophosphoryl diester phosphodiesterase (GDPDase)
MLQKSLAGACLIFDYIELALAMALPLMAIPHQSLGGGLA